MLPYANAVHYGERRKSFRAALGAGGVPAVGYATDAGAGLYYQGAELVEAVADRANARAYRVERHPDGSVTEETIEVRRLR